MTVKELLAIKYCDKMATITEREWDEAKKWAIYYNSHPAEFIFRCLEIDENDIKQHDGWHGELHKDLMALNDQKLLASNRNKSGFERHFVLRYWLTEKGYKKIFGEGAYI